MATVALTENERESLRALRIAERNLLDELAALVPESVSLARRIRTLRVALKTIRREIRALLEDVA